MSIKGFLLKLSDTEQERLADGLGGTMALDEMAWIASEGDLAEALGHESEVSCQLSRLEGIICKLTYGK
ncbi:MAG: hypothetical protein AB4050_11475 [Synechococcus sp.]